MIKKLAVIILSTTIVVACGANEAEINPAPSETSATQDQSPLDPISISGVEISGNSGSAPVIKVLEVGSVVDQLQIADQKVGVGTAVPAGATVLAHYVGYGLTTGLMFQSSWDLGSPIQFGLDQVIAGWGEGIPGMKIGGRRILVIPAELAYGQNPPPDSGIQPGEALLFVIDLVDFI